MRSRLDAYVEMRDTVCKASWASTSKSSSGLERPYKSDRNFEMIPMVPILCGDDVSQTRRIYLKLF